MSRETIRTFHDMYLKTDSYYSEENLKAALETLTKKLKTPAVTRSYHFVVVTHYFRVPGVEFLYEFGIESMSNLQLEKNGTVTLYRVHNLKKIMQKVCSKHAKFLKFICFLSNFLFTNHLILLLIYSRHLIYLIYLGFYKFSLILSDINKKFKFILDICLFKLVVFSILLGNLFSKLRKSKNSMNLIH
jgi:hypothetical protein